MAVPGKKSQGVIGIPLAFLRLFFSCSCKAANQEDVSACTFDYPAYFLETDFFCFLAVRAGFRNIQHRICTAMTPKKTPMLSIPISVTEGPRPATKD